MTDRGEDTKAHQDRVAARVNTFWDLSKPLPSPRLPLKCTCGSREHVIKRWYFFEHPRKKRSYRCDITTKCKKCSKVEIYGVVVPEELFTKHTNRKVYYKLP